MSVRYYAMALLVAVAATASAQRDSIIVKTEALHRLSGSDAVQLLTPYMLNGGAVYSAGSHTKAVTLRGTSQMIAEAEKLLAKYDRDPGTYSLNFQLIAADYTNTRDAQLSSLDSLMRSVLKFTGYHLMATAFINVSEGSIATQTLTADGQDYRLACELDDVVGDGAATSLRLKVSLQRMGLFSSNGTGQRDPVVLTTGLTIPIGNTVVLGSAVERSATFSPGGFAPPGQTSHVGTINGVGDQPSAAQSSKGSDRALILTVKPQATTAAVRRD